jgi:threonine synthase
MKFVKDEKRESIKYITNQRNKRYKYIMKQYEESLINQKITRENSQKLVDEAYNNK